MGSTLRHKDDLMLALRSQIFECLRETFCRRALRAPSIGLFRKKTVFLRKRRNIDLFEGLWSVGSGDTFSPLEPVPDSEQQNHGGCHPLPLLMAFSMVLNVLHSSR